MERPPPERLTPPFNGTKQAHSDLISHYSRCSCNCLDLTSKTHIDLTPPVYLLSLYVLYETLSDIRLRMSLAYLTKWQKSKTGVIKVIHLQPIARYMVILYLFQK